MRVIIAFEVDVDQGTRPSTGFRRVDQVVRTTASFLARLRHVKALGEIRVCDRVQAESWVAQVRYDGHQVAPLLESLPAGISG